MEIQEHKTESMVFKEAEQVGGDAASNVEDTHPRVGRKPLHDLAYESCRILLVIWTVTPSSPF